MDGLSIAASIAGLVALAMELTKTTRKLISFLDTIHDAPTEVVRLNGLLKLVCSTTVHTINAVELQSRGRGGHIPGREHIYEILVVCLQRLSPIQDALNKTEGFRLGNNVVSRSWVKLKLALKRDDMLEMERQLEQALSVLNVSLTTMVL
ncbi:hypothetical protein CSOJ01_13857 [Colletotrichum sojae]|uniref:Fungal N-terminal domain-containing protein n=1 Tax=Colletotrichum sojae TaxID=2175907 RepID=A0A8H6MKL1_9PEZI|nr:hypothetical protein CSOJ01_13857 [Colletotrichum sojae]